MTEKQSILLSPEEIRDIVCKTLDSLPRFSLAPYVIIKLDGSQEVAKAQAKKVLERMEGLLEHGTGYWAVDIEKFKAIKKEVEG
jgi:hypothetical protein